MPFFSRKRSPSPSKDKEKKKKKDDDCNKNNDPPVCGPTGPMGPQGCQGPQGPRGPMGPAGEQGCQGPTGPTGPTGCQGPKGDVGDKGCQGPQGPQGPRGPSGKDGPTGPAGPMGPVGCQGPKGDKGDKGCQGPQGDQGPTGATGATGPRGPAGCDVAVLPTIHFSLGGNGVTGTTIISSMTNLIPLCQSLTSDDNVLTVADGEVAVLEPGLYMYHLSVQGSVTNTSSSSNSIIVNAHVNGVTAPISYPHSMDSGLCFATGIINMTDIGTITVVFDGATKRFLRSTSPNTMTINLAYNSICIAIQRIRA